MREAADREDWTLHYQPIRNAKTGCVRAVEALLRWDYPDLGLVTPSEFLEVAEDIGLSSAIGDWVLREACLQAARWRDAGFEGIRVSANVSPLNACEPVSASYKQHPKAQMSARRSTFLPRA